MNTAIWINGVKLPINPPEIRFKLPSDNQRYRLLGLGEVNVLRDAKLAEVTFEGLLPPHHIPGVDSGALSPAEYIHGWRKIMEAKEPVGFVYVGDGWDIVMPASIEGLDYREKGGAVGWLEYTMTAVKWVSYAAKKVAAPVSSGVAVSYPRTEEAPSAADMKPKTSGAAKKASVAKTQSLTIGGSRAMRDILEHIGMPESAQGSKYTIPMSSGTPN